MNFNWHQWTFIKGSNFNGPLQTVDLKSLLSIQEDGTLKRNATTVTDRSCTSVVKVFYSLRLRGHRIRAHTQFKLVESCLSVCSLVSSTPFMFKSVKHDKKLKKKKKRTENSREELPVDSLSSSEAPSEQAFAFFLLLRSVNGAYRLIVHISTDSKDVMYTQHVNSRGTELSPGCVCVSYCL